jgi:hypothetical protein
MWLIGIIGMVMLMVGCAEVGTEAHSKARGVEEGATEAELVQTAGPPTEQSETPSRLCKEAGASRELVYTVSARYLGGWHRDSPMYAIAFCVDDSSKIVAKLFIDW